MGLSRKEYCWYLDASARKGIEICGQNCHQGLALARLHFRNLPAMQHHASNELHIKGPQSQHAV